MQTSKDDKVLAINTTIKELVGIMLDPDTKLNKEQRTGLQRAITDLERRREKLLRRPRLFDKFRRPA